MDQLERKQVDMQKDAMTGAYTREHMLPALKKKILEARLRKERFSILLVDIDHFKEINEKYGHIWGDHFLKFEITTLLSTLQKKDLVFRYGGDEFVVIFSSPDPKEAYLLAKQFNMMLDKRPFLFGGRLFRMSVSCGLATYPDDAKGAEELLRAADNALYFSKKSGRSTTTQASKIGLQRLKIFSLTSLKVLFIGALAFFLFSYLFRTEVQKTIKTSLINKLLSTVLKADTKIILKDGNIIEGRVIAEDENKLVVVTPLDKETISIILKKPEFNSD